MNDKAARYEPRRRPEETHVAVLMGGWSSEREVSLASGAAVAEALRSCGYEVTEVDVDRDIAERLREIAPDVAFNALHGRFGEDGRIQGLLEILDIPYTHSGVLASALAMDKHRAKALFHEAGVPVAESRIVPLEEAAERHPMSPPYVIKPVAEGSSVGIHIVHSRFEEPVSQLLEEREVFGDFVMVERFAPGRELTCAVMGDVALGVLEIVPKKGSFYDYASKYEEGGSEHICPADIPASVYYRVQVHALAAHQALGCRGVTRADFRYDDTASEDADLVLLEINTQPGMTKTSLLPDIARVAGHSFEELVMWMVDDASTDR
jgi:D-alanine-D-alanine ligase